LLLHFWFIIEGALFIVFQSIHQSAAIHIQDFTGDEGGAV